MTLKKTLPVLFLVLGVFVLGFYVLAGFSRECNLTGEEQGESAPAIQRASASPSVPDELNPHLIWAVMNFLEKMLVV
ncbi:MAG: hypothetical protein C4582_08685 [Desulfobacteraceae bacterium]|jgi:hypothetical protein|nr:MAG: hypothetical protein C4582_08685 [Desulfobacteraceae bacterium]